MPTLLEKLGARLAYRHAQSVFRAFARALERPARAEQRVLRRVLGLVADSAFGRARGLRSVRTLADLRRAAPLATYEDMRPYIDRVCDGDVEAMFGRGQRLLMFATSSGTTAAPKRIPVTPAFVRDYRRGWNTFGLKMLSDHPRAVLRAILQSSGRYDSSHTATGVPCGAITGLLARMQKRIVRRFYVGKPEIALLDDAQARYYTLMRLGAVRDIAFAITANPATLIQMARVASAQAETLIRDVHDGTLAETFVPDAGLRQTLLRGVRPAPARARELAALRARQGALRPRDMWGLEFLACWIGGSLGHYRPRLAEWWGEVPVRDVGLLASEGRVSIPLDDDTPAGVLDVTSGVFEFIPAEQADAATPEVVCSSEVEVGRDYVVVLTNTSGLVRYRLEDVVRVRGRVGATPTVEFLYRAGRVASVAGEKLTENQVVAAMQAACAAVGVPVMEFILAPCWGDPPFYRLSLGGAAPADLGPALDAALAEQNEEYASRRSSQRLGGPTVRPLPPESIDAVHARLAAARRGAAEQFKAPALFTEPGQDDALLGLTPVEPV